MKSIILTVLFVLSCPLLMNAQTSKAYDVFVEQHSEGRTLHIYQSVFRLANLEANKDFNKLIKHVEKINVHRFPAPDSTRTKSMASELYQIMKDDGFEEMITFKQAKSTIRLTMKGDEKEGQFLIYIFSKDGSFVADMDGSFDLRYLGAFASGSFDKLEGLMGNKMMNFN